ncbi:MAG: hypothetical protein H7Y43_08615 [Akkermansiaceae bacterium]|nr:hypothetical protein [Verrucomicrobiales bacterium]
MKTFVSNRSITGCFKQSALTLALLAGLTASAPAQLLYQWNFDTAVSGTTVAPNVAVGGGGGLTMNYGGVATDLYGPLGGGVSGGAGDRAFANNNNTYNNSAQGGVVQSTAGDMNIGALSQFTLTGWIKADGGFSANTANSFKRLFVIGQGTPDVGSANSIGVATYTANNANGTNSFQLKLGGAGGNIAGPNGGDGLLTGADTLTPFGSGWTFFAVSADLSLTANNVSIYFGSQGSLNSPLTFSFNNAGVAIGSINLGATASALLLNNSSRARGFDGFGDDFRLYSGALDAATVEGIRFAATPVPEPGVGALVGLGLLVVIGAVGRRNV